MWWPKSIRHAARSGAALQILLLCVTPVAGQGDVFNVNTEPGGCQQAKSAEAQRYADRMNELQKKEADIHNQYNHDAAACQGNRGCVESAQQRYAERMRQLSLEREDEGARHSKALIDIDHLDACMGTPPPLRTACDRAKFVEQRQYSRNMAELQKKEVDIHNQYQHDVSPCRDAGCRDGADRSYGGRMTQLSLERGDENTRHQKALLDIDRGNCSGAPPAIRGGTDTYSGGPGRQPPVRGGTSTSGSGGNTGVQPPISGGTGGTGGTGTSRNKPSDPYDVRKDVPGADPNLRYTLGVERGVADCLEKQVTAENLVLSALGAKYAEIAMALRLLAIPGAIDGVLHPPGSSTNSNPYLRGKDEGYRLCDWALRVGPATIARYPGGASMTGGGEEPFGRGNGGPRVPPPRRGSGTTEEPIVGGPGKVTPGAPGTLTIRPNSRLRPDEISTGVRLAKQEGLALAEGEHVGEEFVDSTGKTYDAMGTPNAYKYWNPREFFNAITSHLAKSDNMTAIDLKGASPKQVQDIQSFVGGLASNLQNKIIFVRE